MRFGNCLNLQRLEGEGGSNGVHVLGGGSTLAGCVVMWLVADHGFGGDVQALFIILPVERQDVQCYARTETNSVSPSSGRLETIHLWIFHLAPFPTHKVTFSTYPIVIMASLFWQLLVQMAILSPLGLTLTTAPHTSSLASSNDSPTKHKSCKIHKISHCMSRIVPFIMNHNIKKIEARLEPSFHLKHHELLVLRPTL